MLYSVISPKEHRKYAHSHGRGVTQVLVVASCLIPLLGKKRVWEIVRVHEFSQSARETFERIEQLGEKYRLLTKN